MKSLLASGLLVGSEVSVDSFGRETKEKEHTFSMKCDPGSPKKICEKNSYMVAKYLCKTTDMLLSLVTPHTLWLGKCHGKAEMFWSPHTRQVKPGGVV